MQDGDKVITKEGYIGTIAYKVGGAKAMENKWCVHFPNKTLGDFYEFELKPYNIFEGVKFGDKYLTRDGRTAIVTDIRDTCISLFIQKGTNQVWGEINYVINDNGKFDDLDRLKALDIVSKYQESVDLDKVNELAQKDYLKTDFFDQDPRKEYMEAKEKELIELMSWYLEREDDYSCLLFHDEENKGLTMAEIIVRDFLMQEK